MAKPARYVLQKQGDNRVWHEVMDVFDYGWVFGTRCYLLLDFHVKPTLSGERPKENMCPACVKGEVPRVRRYEMAVHDEMPPPNEESANDAVESVQ